MITNKHINSILILILITGIYVHFVQVAKLNNRIDNQVSLQVALTDTIRTYRNANDELVYTKLSLQADIDRLTSSNTVLTREQSELIKTVKNLNKKNELFAAALIDSEIRLSDLTNNKPVEVTDSTIIFNHVSDTLSYSIVVNPVANPSLTIKSLIIPNDITVAFTWSDNKAVSFSTSNSNPLLRVNNIEFYVIPEIQKETLKRNFWQRIKKGSKTTTGKAIIFTAGILTGIIIK